MGAFLKPFAGIFGAICVVLLVAWGPYITWYDRHPDAQPLIHWHWGIFGKKLINLDWPDNPSRAGAEAKAALARQLADDKAATEAAKGVYTAAIKGWATLGRQESAKLQAALQNVRIVHDQAASEIHNYVTPQIDKRYPLPWAIVRLHDAYALGFASAAAAGITLPAGQSDGDPSPFEDSDLASVLNDNYSADRVCRAELKSWQEWYPKMAATWTDAISRWPKAPK